VACQFGNLTSQFFANLYLNELDQFVKHVLKCRYYLRYVDILLFLTTAKKNCWKQKQKIEEFLRQKLFLELHPDKWKIAAVSEGIDFLGYVVKPTHILVRKR